MARLSGLPCDRRRRQGTFRLTGPCLQECDEIGHFPDGNGGLESLGHERDAGALEARDFIAPHRVRFCIKRFEGETRRRFADEESEELTAVFQGRECRRGSPG